MSHRRAFLRSVARNFRRTGAIAPSSRFLGRAMTFELVRRYRSPAAVLEVGGGTGSITEVIAEAIGPGDHLDVFEIDPDMSGVIRRRVQEEPCFSHARSAILIHNEPIEAIDRQARYDFIISCLPFTNFKPAMVREIFEIYRSLLKPDGVCSFFEYMVLRKAARFMNGDAGERRRLSGVAEVVEGYVGHYGYRRDLVFFNIPPAMVHHINFRKSGGR